MCKIIDEDIEGANKWVVGNVDVAVKLMLTRQITNFDSLIANIENHKDLYNFVWSVLVDGKQIEYNLHTLAMRKGILHGVITNDDGSLNMEFILEKYMEAMKKLHDDKQDVFIEKNAKLLFSS